MLKKTILALILVFTPYIDLLAFQDEQSVKTIRRIFDFADEYKVDVKFYYDWQDRRIAVFNYDFEIIYLNLSSYYWKDIDWYIKRDFKENWFSSDNKDCVFLHEIGHVLLFRHIGYKKFIKIKDIPINKKLITKEVSIYAATNATEFFAEVFSGLQNKRVFSSEIMDIYQSLWDS